MVFVALVVNVLGVMSRDFVDGWSFDTSQAATARSFAPLADGLLARQKTLTFQTSPGWREQDGKKRTSTHRFPG